ncbi:hypothetical protein NQ318_009669 [Aromia moschata]|uniref:Uncharacterized protein n=1 Tax=Aromia moschata TaxID=1265417 RepID=A0AAV8Y0G1_9CUCU|nr:hypothetical protein NQ318_009669 [Aromia moschata]
MNSFLIDALAWKLFVATEKPRPKLSGLLCMEEVNYLHELRQRIQEAANTFKNNREIFRDI